jgi:hypothetical protein
MNRAPREVSEEGGVTVASTKRLPGVLWRALALDTVFNLLGQGLPLALVPHVFALPAGLQWEGRASLQVIAVDVGDGL